MIEKKDKVKHCMIRSRDSFDEAIVLAKSKLWNGVANRLYYSCYYAVNALFIKEDLMVSGHKRINELCNEKLVLTNIISEKGNNVFKELSRFRQQDEFDGFVKFSSEQIEPLITETQKFINEAEWALY